MAPAKAASDSEQLKMLSKSQCEVDEKTSKPDEEAAKLQQLEVIHVWIFRCQSGVVLKVVRKRDQNTYLKLPI